MLKLNQGFDTVEINASFYRFPSTGWIKAWIRSPEDFTFSIKVHRSITHLKRLKVEAVPSFERFKNFFKDLEDRVDFWLFQMPPNFKATVQNMDRIRAFFREVNLGNSAVIEFRDEGWWEVKDVCRDAGVAFCSVDAPDLPREVVCLNDVVYVRLHGREAWYDYEYSKPELRGIVDKMLRLKAKRKAIYLNNDHGMLPNGRHLMHLVRSVK